MVVFSDVTVDADACIGRVAILAHRLDSSRMVIFSDVTVDADADADAVGGWVLVMVCLVSARLIVRPNAHGSRDAAQIVEHRDVSEPQLTPGNRQHRQHAYLRRLLLRPEDLPWQGAFRRARPSCPPQPMSGFPRTARTRGTWHGGLGDSWATHH